MKRPRPESNRHEAAKTSTSNVPARPWKRIHIPETPTDEFCKDFLRGKCARGPSCKYVHSIPGTSPSSSTPQPPNFQVSSVNTGSGRIPHHVMAPTPYPYAYPPYYQTPPEFPIEFPTAVYAPAVPYSPPPLFKFPTEQDSSLIACKDFINGRCNRHDGCKFAHVVNHANLPKGESRDSPHVMRFL